MFCKDSYKTKKHQFIKINLIFSTYENVISTLFFFSGGGSSTLEKYLKTITVLVGISPEKLNL